MTRQLPISLHGGEKGEARIQFAALCYRMRRDKMQILLVTSRGRGRWIVPKGWPVEGQTPAQVAALEAWEEAGVCGKVAQTCLGVYSYTKDVADQGSVPCLAMLYPLKVVRLAREFPERHQRRRRWVSRRKAAEMVTERELARMIRDFEPQMKSRDR